MPGTEYMREWRKTPKGQAALAEQKKRAKAKARAVTRLIGRYSEEYNRLFAQEMQRLEEKP